MSGRAGTFILLAMLLGSASPCVACDWGSLSGSVALASDYRFRGVSQSDLAPAPQAELDWNAPRGWTLSVWGSRIDFRDHQNTSIELDPSLDKHFKFAALDIDVEALYHAYPNHQSPPGGIHYSAIEGIVTVSRSWRKLTVSASGAWSPDNVGQTGVGWDAEFAATYAFCKWLSIGGIAGEQWVHEWNVRPGYGYPYAYWNAGITARRGHFSLALQYVGTSLKTQQCLLTFGGLRWCQSGAVAILSYAIGDAR